MISNSLYEEVLGKIYRGNFQKLDGNEKKRLESGSRNEKVSSYCLVVC